MNIKLEKIIIYNSDGDTKEVSFKPGLNVITGESKTGKSALLKIIDYCLFSKESNIPFGIIKNYAFIYSLIFKTDNGYIILGREEKNISNYYVLNRKNLEDLSIKDFDNKFTKIDSEAKILLLKYLNINIDNNNNRIKDGVISVRSMVPLLLQPQNTIANPDELFARFNNTFVKKSTLEDYLFLIKKVDSKYLKLKRNIDILKSNIRKDNLKNLVDNDLMGNIRKELLLKIEDFCETLGYEYKNIDFVNLLNYDFDAIFKEKFQDSLYQSSINNNSLKKLQDKRLSLNKKIQSINNKLHIIDLTSEEVNQYYNNSSNINGMLNEILLLNEKESGNSCPLCSHTVEHITKEQKALYDINQFFINDINETEMYDTNIESKKSSLLENRESIQKEIGLINIEINKINKRNSSLDYSIYEKLLILKTEINVLKEKVGLFIKHIDNGKKSKDEEKLSRLEEDFNKISIDDTENTYINEKFNDLVIKFDIEELYKNKKWKFNINNFELYYEDGDKVILPKQVGSGANSLALHISLFLSMLWLSVKNNSYLPKFIFIDQPSQVYFPVDKDGIKDFNTSYEDNDRKKVSDFFIVILDELKLMEELYGYSPQIIITEHANNLKIGDYNFSDYVIENWRKGEVREALI